MVRLLLLASVALGAMPALEVEAGANGFDGITIIEFADEAGEIVSGYTLALNHFFTRPEELRETRAAIENLEGRKPRL